MSQSFKLEPLELCEVKDEKEKLNHHIKFANEEQNTLPTCYDEYICDICHEHFKTKSGLSTHMAMHVKGCLLFKPMPVQLPLRSIRRNVFSCYFENCNKSYSSDRGLRRHVNNVHPNPNSDRVLKPQNKTEIKKFFCLKCPKWFGVQEKLDGHIRRDHEGLKVETFKLSQTTCFTFEPVL